MSVAGGLTDDKEADYRSYVYSFNKENPEQHSPSRKSIKPLIVGDIANISDSVCQLDDEFGKQSVRSTRTKIRALKFCIKYDMFPFCPNLFGMPRGDKTGISNLIRKRKISKSWPDTIRKAEETRKCMVCLGRNLFILYKLCPCQPCFEKKKFWGFLKTPGYFCSITLKSLKPIHFCDHMVNSILMAAYLMSSKLNPHGHLVQSFSIEGNFYEAGN